MATLTHPTNPNMFNITGDLAIESVKTHVANLVGRLIKEGYSDDDIQDVIRTGVFLAVTAYHLSLYDVFGKIDSEEPNGVDM